MNNKTAGLYVSLAKALNALEEAGESPAVYSLGIEGISSGVTWNYTESTWTVGDTNDAGL
jgi:hypothetical protein